MSEKKPIYVRMLNPKPSEVNKTLEDGYSLHTVNYHNANLIYHFIKEVTETYELTGPLPFFKKMDLTNSDIHNINWHENQ